MSISLNELHNVCMQLSNATFSQRLEHLCQFFLNVPYGAWQDGSDLESLDDFKYQLDLLDCVLFVEVVLALAKTEPVADFSVFSSKFEKLLRQLHYANGKSNYISRNHFMCVDWIVNNKFVVEDITHSLWPNIKTAETIIDKLEWLRHQKIITESNEQISPELAAKIPQQKSVVPYIDTEDLLQNQQYFLNAFPEYCIVNIVRPNWDLTDRIGTHLNISHLGFAFNNKERQEISFYHATIESNLVEKTTLFSYMQKHRESPTIRGINVLAISPGF